MYLFPHRPGESIFELLKEPAKRKTPAQNCTIDHILEVLMVWHENRLEMK